MEHFVTSNPKICYLCRIKSYRPAMKKRLLTLIIALFGVLSVQAQIWIGGSANATLGKELKTFSIAPDVGYCIPNTPFSIACAVEYAGTLQNGEDYCHSVTISPYFRYDICEIGERFSLFVDLVSDFDALEFSSFDIGLCPGISFDLTDHWSAEFYIGFLGYEWEQVADDEVERCFVLDFKTVAPSFGIYYNF